MSDVKYGDRVRITIEGEWTRRQSPEHCLSVERELGLNAEDTWTVEKIEPPVVTFKPGDVVRNSMNTYALAPYGFLIVAAKGTAEVGTFIPYGDCGRYKAKHFTSDAFEKVNIE